MADFIKLYSQTGSRLLNLLHSSLRKTVVFRRSKFWVRNTLAYRELWGMVRRGVYARSAFDLIDEYIAPGHLLIDIGAGAGALALYASSIGGRVLALEGDHVSFKELRSNVAFNLRLRSKIRIRKWPSSLPIGPARSNPSLRQDLLRLCDSLAEKDRIFAHAALISIDLRGGEYSFLTELLHYLHGSDAAILVMFYPHLISLGETDAAAISLDQTAASIDAISILESYNIFLLKNGKRAAVDRCSLTARILDGELLSGRVLFVPKEPRQ